MKKEHTSIDSEIGDHWVGFSILGYGVGGVAGWFTVFFSSFFFSTSFLFDSRPLAFLMAMGGMIAGTSVGLAQWQAIRLKAPHANKLVWMAGYIAGLSICWTLFSDLVLFDLMFSVTWANTTNNTSAFLMTGVIGIFWGLLVATIQWHTLQGQIQRPAIWFTLNSVCGVLVFIAGWIWLWIPPDALGYSDEFAWLSHSITSPMICWPVAGTLYGMITRSLLTRSLIQPNKQSEVKKHVLAE